MGLLSELPVYFDSQSSSVALLTGPLTASLRGCTEVTQPHSCKKVLQLETESRAFKKRSQLSLTIRKQKRDAQTHGTQKKLKKEPTTRADVTLNKYHFRPRAENVSRCFVLLFFSHTLAHRSLQPGVPS